MLLFRKAFYAKLLPVRTARRGYYCAWELLAQHALLRRQPFAIETTEGDIAWALCGPLALHPARKLPELAAVVLALASCCCAECTCTSLLHACPAHISFCNALCQPVVW